MRPATNNLIEPFRVNGPPESNSGFFSFDYGPFTLRVQASDGGGWDHVSVSTPRRCPDWSEMCWIKDKFFLPEECVMQLHVPAKDHLNLARFCLHLWRPQSDAEIAVVREQWGDEWPYGDLRSPGSIPRPPSIMVAPKIREATPCR